MSFSSKLRELRTKAKQDSREEGISSDRIAVTLHRPDTLIGNIQKEETEIPVISDGKILWKSLTFSPAIVKLFDEILVNAIDHKTRMQTTQAGNGDKVTKIAVNIRNGEITIANNGRGLPIKIDPESGKYLPELYFTRLDFGGNYDDERNRMTGGKNGVGASVTNIFSEYFKVSTISSGQQYVQEFRNNLDIIGSPIITECNDKLDVTRISYKPDYSFMGKSSINDILPIIERRVYDLAALYKPGELKIMYNGSPIKITKFEDYVKLIHTGETLIMADNLSKTMPCFQWKFAIFPGKGKRISFVNGIHTRLGGPHESILLDKMTDLIARNLPKNIYDISKPDRDNKYLKKASIRNMLSFVLVVFIANPEFSTQTKDKLNDSMRSKLLKTFPKIVEKDVQKFMKTPDFQVALEDAIREQIGKVDGKNQGKKSKFLSKIEKLDDAAEAGGGKSTKCTLILTEGDSASGGIRMALSALGKAGSDYYGILTMRGKPPNPRKKILMTIENKFFSEFRQAMGLDTNEKYTKLEDLKKLRYGSIMIMSDADYDGANICCLIMNLIHYFWPELLLMPGFIQKFRTPCVKATYNNHIYEFDSLEQFAEWEAQIPEKDRGKIDKDYYKGLATNTDEEFQSYFAKLNKNAIQFQHESATGVDNILKTAFGEDTDIRKKWMTEFTSDDNIQYDKKVMNLEKIINRDQSIVSRYFLLRSVPHIMDGLKPVQRKIICLLMRDKIYGKKKTKISNIAADLVKYMDYHHGDKSANDAACRLAQNFTGSNNVNLLEPLGNFGNREHGTAEFGQGRYIFTRLTKSALRIYDPADMDIIDYTYSEGKRLEPIFFTGVLPMVLINGTSSIGTGWSSKIYRHNPHDIMKYLAYKIRGKDTSDLIIRPYYRGYTGNIEINYENGIRSPSHYIIRGKYYLDGKTLVIDQVPVLLWYHKFKQLLKKYHSMKIIKGFRAEVLQDKDTRIQKTTFTIKLSDQYYNKLIKNMDDTVDDDFSDDEDDDEPEPEIKLKYNIPHDFKMAIKCNNCNMNLFDATGKIRHYKTIYEIIDDFYESRLPYYTKRKNDMISKLQHEFNIAKSRYEFIKAVAVEKVIDIRNIRREELIKYLMSEEKYIKFDNYKYLTSMPIYSFTVEKIAELKDKMKNMLDEIERIKSTPETTMWKDDILAINKLL